MSIALYQMSSLCASRNSCPLEPRALSERGLHTWTASVDSVPFGFWLGLASGSPSRRPEGKGCSLLVHSLWGIPRLPAFLPPRSLDLSRLLLIQLCFSCSGSLSLSPHSSRPGMGTAPLFRPVFPQHHLWFPYTLPKPLQLGLSVNKPSSNYRNLSVPSVSSHSLADTGDLPAFPLCSKKRDSSHFYSNSCR